MLGGTGNQRERCGGIGLGRRGVAQPGAVARGLLAALLLAGCGEAERGTAPASSVEGSGGSDGAAGAFSEGAGGSGGSGGAGGNGGSGGAGGSATTGGATGTSEPAGGAGGDGAELGPCTPESESPLDDCQYPESLGGSGEADRCGVTPAAWYPLGNSELTAWPERALWEAEGGARPSWRFFDDAGPPIAFDSEDRPVIAWFDDDSIELRRWNGDAWQTFAPGAPAPAETHTLRMVLDQTGEPVVAAGGASMLISRWSAGGWESLGEWPGGFPRTFAMTLDSEDRPIVVYNRGGLLFAERWDGAAFAKLTGDAAEGSLTERATGEPALALRQNGDLVVAWTEAPGSEFIENAPRATYLLQWHDERWEALGDSPAISAEVAAVDVDGAPAIAVDANDQVIVAWDHQDGAIRIWDGNVWWPEETGLDRPQLLKDPHGSVFLAGNEQLELWQWQSDEWEPLTIPLFQRWGWEPGLAFGNDGSLAVARSGYFWAEIQVLMDQDGEWRSLGGSPAAPEVGLGRAPWVSGGVDLVTADDSLFVDGDCWVDRWDGANWQPLDLGAWVGAQGDCNGSTLTESPTGQLVLALWVEAREHPDYEPEMGDTPTNWLHLLGWTGEAWQELAAPLAHDGLVDDPQIAFDATGTPFIAWSDHLDEAGGYDVFVVTWDGTDWVTLHEEPVGEGEPQLLALPDEGLILSWRADREVQGSALYQAGEWQYLGTLPFPDGAQVQLVLDDNGTPFLTWPTADTLALHELAAGGWRAVLADEARLATLPEHIRTHALSENGEVYVRHFDDCRWHGLSASDRDGGVSNSEHASQGPSVVLHDGATCVAWLESSEKSENPENSDEDFLVLARCHD